MPNLPRGTNCACVVSYHKTLPPRVRCCVALNIPAAMTPPQTLTLFGMPALPLSILPLTLFN